MSVLLFTPEQVEQLNSNPYVVQATDRRIIYSDDFKKLFVKQYSAGLTPGEIFFNAGFDVKALGCKRIERAADRWRTMNNEGRLGDEIDYVEVHRERQSNRVSLREQLNQQRALIDQLENENLELRKQLLQLAGA